jgi:hypothetical protein
VPSAGHSHVVDVFNVARVDGVYVIPYVALIELREHSAVVEGAKTSMFWWKSNHQKGVELRESAYALVMA